MRRELSATQCTSGHQRLRILQLLIAHGESSGAQLLDRDRSLPRGTIYTTLKRLEAAKFVTSRRAAKCEQPGPRRRFYKITSRGARCCRLSLKLARALADTA